MRLGEMVLAAHREGVVAAATRKDRRSQHHLLVLERGDRRATIVATNPDLPVGPDVVTYVEAMLGVRLRSGGDGAADAG